MGNKLTDSVQRAFAILEAFTPSNPQMRLQEVADKTGLPKVTAFRYFRTLTSLGYVGHETDSKTYFLTPKVMSLGFVVLASLELRDVAFPFLEELARMTDQNVNLGIADKTEVVYIERIKRRRILNIDNYVGSRLSIYRSSIGLALLAFMGESEFQHSLEEILKEAKGAPHVGSKGELLIERIEEVRKCGYAVNNEELMTGLRAIAAPVFDRRGRAEGAINLPVFSIEVSMEDLIDRYLPLLLETAEKISTARGFTKPRDSQTAKGSEE